MQHKIISVEPNSIAQKNNIVVGDILLTINSKRIHDFVDYEFFINNPKNKKLVLEIVSQNGTTKHVNIVKNNQKLGIEFENSMMSHVRSCQNNCVFCFVDQNPPDMRKTMYVKDDDWRMSFLMGNYVTLTNVREKELERIIERKVSPLYISVHTTDEALRQKMTNCKNALQINHQLNRLCKANINFHSQIVLCKNINDGESLKKTLKDLYSKKPNALGVAIVPVGTTKFRENLPKLELFEKQSANQVIDLIENFNENNPHQNKYGEKQSFAMASDEFYIVAQREFPKAEEYGSFEQIENGVGMVRKFEGEFLQAMELVPKNCAIGKSFTVATGTSAFSYMSKLAKMASEKTGATIDVVAIKNDFFGETVTATGLVVGQDLQNQLSNKNVNQKVLIPQNMLLRELVKQDGSVVKNVFLDDTTLQQLCEKLKKPVINVEVDGFAFLGAIANMNLDNII